ncbi:hypothetical protein [Paracoccus gahaiensis]|uniref:hypothetical protein n=1 Tax=Paracoccus gahaiensis TaxID=1706839 RepID=UPI00145F319A|nr:hypothetical protein [Paracoccus gahaiensis]
MPLTHFLMLIAAVILAAGLTLWFGLSAGVPPAAILVVTLGAALLLHLGQRNGHDHDS